MCRNPQIELGGNQLQCIKVSPSSLYAAYALDQAKKRELIIDSVSCEYELLLASAAGNQDTDFDVRLHSRIMHLTVTVLY